MPLPLAPKSATLKSGPDGAAETAHAAALRRAKKRLRYDILGGYWTWGGGIPCVGLRDFQAHKPLKYIEMSNRGCRGHTCFVDAKRLVPGQSASLRSNGFSSFWQRISLTSHSLADTLWASS